MVELKNPESKMENWKLKGSFEEGMWHIFAYLAFVCSLILIVLLVFEFTTPDFLFFDSRLLFTTTNLTISFAS